MSFLGEIRRRKVFQVAAVYAVVAWLTIQVVDVVAEPLSLPDWFDTVVIVLFAVGFPLATILAWAFDITPGGIKQTSKSSTVDPIFRTSSHRLNYITHGLVLLAVGFLVFDQYVLRPRTDLPAAPLPRDTVNVRRALEIGLGETERIGDTGLDVHPAISRDGRDLVFAIRRGGHSQLYHRPIDQLEATPIPGTVGAFFPSFSPDGDSVLFFSAETENILKRVSIETGAVQVLGAALFPNGASWGEDGTLFVATQDSAGGRSIFSLSANGAGDWQEILAADDNQGFVEPHVLPGGRSLVVGTRPGIGGVGSARDGRIVALDLEDGETVDLIQGGLQPQYAPSGHLVFARRGDLWAVPFDAERLAVTGDEVRVITGVQQDGAFGKAAYTFSEEGTLVYFPGVDTTARNTPRSLVWVDRNGNEEALDVEPSAYYYPRLSGEGRLVVSIYDGQGTDLWVHNLDRFGLNRLTFDGADRAIWSHDRSRIYYNRTGENAGFYWQASDGSGEPQLLTTTNNLQRPVSLSNDGHELIFESLIENNWGLYALSVAEGTVRPVIDESFNEILGEISPDGRHVLYVGVPQELSEIYVRPYPSLSGRWQISQGGSWEARWSPAGNEIFYRRGNEMWVASIEIEDASDGIQIVESRRLFSTEPYFTDNNNRPTFDVAADGQRLLMMKSQDESADSLAGQSSLVVVENWFEELTRLAPSTE